MKKEDLETKVLETIEAEEFDSGWRWGLGVGISMTIIAVELIHYIFKI